MNKLIFTSNKEYRACINELLENTKIDYYEQLFILSQYIENNVFISNNEIIEGDLKTTRRKKILDLIDKTMDENDIFTLELVDIEFGAKYEYSIMDC